MSRINIIKIILFSLYSSLGLPGRNDSIKQIKTADETASPAATYCRLAKQFILNDPKKALGYAKKGLELYTDYRKTGVGSQALFLVATAYKNTGDYDSSLFYYNLCYKIRSQFKSSPLLIAEVINGQGIVYSKLGKFDQALEFFMKCQKIFEDIRDSAFTAKGFNNIANIHYSTNNIEKALFYYEKSLAIKEKLHDKEATNSSRLNIANILIETKQYEKAKNYLDLALKYAIETDNKPDQGILYNKLAFLYFEKRDLPVALKNNLKALQIRENIKDEYGITECYLDIGMICSYMHNSKEAINNYKKALEHATHTHALEQLCELNDHISAEYMITGDYKNAYNYLFKYVLYLDSIKNEHTSDKIAELQEKYEVKGKEKNIEKLSLQKAEQDIELYKKKNQVNYILFISVVVLLIVSLLYYQYSLKQKTRNIEREMLLNQERIKSAEEKRMLQEKQQKELLNVVINAQEEERRKIAIDIHDGLGQLLSGIKLNLHLAISDKSISPQTGETLKNIQQLNDDSITESKNMASNLLPYNIKDFGLVAAIKNLCYNNNQLKISAINFYSNDVPRKLPGELEIAVYRITQELINNALKHAKAKEIFVQLFYRENKLILQVEDDGVGFIQNQRENKINSMGLKNIEIRVQLLSGLLEIDSVLNKGTTTLIEFPLIA